jgi:hypothetical protein
MTDVLLLICVTGVMALALGVVLASYDKAALAAAYGGAR